MISTKGRYALRVMVDIANQPEGRNTPLKGIAERQEISQKYLEIIMKELVRGGFLKSVSGKGGGYRLTRKPEEYTVGEILEWMEGSLASVACLADESNHCPRAPFCPTLPMWEEFDQMVHDFFYGKTLEDLIVRTVP